MPDCLLTAPPRPVENPAIPVHIVRNPRDDNPVKSASRYTCSNHSTNPSAVVYIFRFGEAADPTPFKLSIRLSWPKPNRAEPPGAGQPATQPADKAPAKDQTSPPTPEDSPR